MNARRAAGAYAALVGLAMVGLRVGLLATGGVPEVGTAPAENGFHLAAEFLTALALPGTGAMDGR